MKQTVRIGSVLTLALLLVASWGNATAEESKSEKPAKTEKKTSAKPAPEQEESPYEAATRKPTGVSAGDGATVITNEYLEKMMSGLTEEERLSGVYQAKRHIGDSSAESPETEPGSETQAVDDTSSDSTSGSGDSESTASVPELQAKVTQLERRLLALKNPLLPRRYSDRKDEEDPDWSEKDNLQRIQETEQELAEARAELAEARKKSRSD
jgi:hypothetical protein